MKVAVERRVVGAELQTFPVHAESFVVRFERALCTIRVEPVIAVHQVKAVRNKFVLTRDPTTPVGILDARRNLHSFAGQAAHLHLILHAEVRRVLKRREDSVAWLEMNFKYLVRRRIDFCSTHNLRWLAELNVGGVIVLGRNRLKAFRVLDATVIAARLVPPLVPR